MRRPPALFAAGLILAALLLQSCAQDDSAPDSGEAAFGPKVDWNEITDVQVINQQGQALGRIEELALDLPNGRIVAVLVVYGQTLGFGGKTVAVPPRALHFSQYKAVYQLNLSVAAFQAAPAFDESTWAKSIQLDRMEAAYHYFGQTPNFLVTGESAGRTTQSGRPVISLGNVKKMSTLLRMPVENAAGARLGRLGSLTLDVPNGKILNAFIYIPDASRATMNMFRGSTTVIPPTMLSFNAKGDALVLDIDKSDFRQQPHVLIANGTNGKPSHYYEQPATGPHTSLPLEQGASRRDILLTANISQAIQDLKLDPAVHVEVGTLDGRVTLRGSVSTQSIKDSIGTIAIREARLDNVDNQIEVGPPPGNDQPAAAAPPGVPAVTAK